MGASRFERRVLAGGFAVAAGYLAVALVALVVAANAAVAICFAVMAVVIGAPLAVVASVLESPRGQDGPSDRGSGGDSGWGPPDGGGDDPALPGSTWAEFERALREHMDAEAARTARGDRGGTPTPV